jgi:hypothetical protein
MLRAKIPRPLLFSVVFAWERELELTLGFGQQNTSDRHNVVIKRKISRSAPKYQPY